LVSQLEHNSSCRAALYITSLSPIERLARCTIFGPLGDLERLQQCSELHGLGFGNSTLSQTAQVAHMEQLSKDFKERESPLRFIHDESHQLGPRLPAASVVLSGSLWLDELGSLIVERDEVLDNS
jgi:hypothetical protein